MDRFRKYFTPGDKESNPVIQFIKFSIVGVSNVIISYGIDLICNYILFAGNSWTQEVRTFVNSAMAFFISVTHSYYWNNRVVFNQGKKTWKEHLCSYGKMVACYIATGLILSPLLKNWFVGMGMEYWLACIPVMIITTPLNFVINKCWTFRGKPKKSAEENG